jgi:hypothetical protein
MRQDIVIGIRNALERGYSIQQAKATLVNAGYNHSEVEEVASYLTGGLNTTPQNPQNLQSLPKQYTTQNTKKSNNVLTWILFSLIVVTAIALILMSFLFRDKIINFLNSLI